MREKLLSREHGFTLLEVVFAVGILAIGIMGYASLKVSNRYSWVFAKDLSLAVHLTGNQLEVMRTAGYYDSRMAVDVVTAAKVHSFTTAEYFNEYGETLGIGDFSPTSVSWTVREGCPSQLTKLVSYTSNWDVGGPKSMSITQVQVRP